MNIVYNKRYIINDFREYLIVERLFSENTAKSYFNDIKHFFSFLDNFEIDFISVKEEEIQLYISELKKYQNASTINRKLSAIKHFYRYLMREKLLKKSPAYRIASMKKEFKLPIYLDKHSVEKIILGPETIKGKRDSIIIEFFYSTGARVSELINVKIGNVNFFEDVIFLFGKGRKERIVPLGSRLKELLYDYIKNIRPYFNKKGLEYIFLSTRGKKLDRSAVWRIIKSRVIINGIDNRISPHKLRHTFATHIIQNNGSIRTVQELLGHKNISTTEIYTHLKTRHLTEAHRRYHPRGIQKKQS